MRTKIIWIVKLKYSSLIASKNTYNLILKYILLFLALEVLLSLPYYCFKVLTYQSHIIENCRYDYEENRNLIKNFRILDYIIHGHNSNGRSNVKQHLKLRFQISITSHSRTALSTSCPLLPLDYHPVLCLEFQRLCNQFLGDLWIWTKICIEQDGPAQRLQL